MYLTEKEIFSQYDALQKTVEYVLSKSEQINQFKMDRPFKSITFTGCGSSYYLCKSAELSAKVHLAIAANSIASGDMMLNLSQYHNMIRNTLLVTSSRSGSTSEVLMAVRSAKEEFHVPVISVCAKENSELSKLSDLILEIPWAFDESVCQTRTVTNLYVANLLLVAILAEDQSIIQEIQLAVQKGKDYMNTNKELVNKIGNDRSWERAVILADGELEGIATEGALAFKEICQVHSNYYHVLDVRHGPMVLIDDRTLVIMATSRNGEQYQSHLINDIQQKGAKVITISEKDVWNSDYNIKVESYKHYAVMGIPFIYVPQCIAYYKALASGINPDLPQGLDPWIKL